MQTNALKENQYEPIHVSRRTDWLGWLNRSIWIAWGLVVVLHLATIGRAPAGLHFDEAHHALDALQIGQDGYWPVFLAANSGREPLSAYAMAASLRLFGNSIWALRFAVALAWAASAPALYWLIRELYPSDRASRTIRWAIAAPVLATSLWYSITAHYACRAAWFVLLMLLFLAALCRVWRTGRARTALLAGVFGGLCFYTYLPNRLLPVLLAGLLVIAWVWRREQLASRWRALALVSLVAVLVSLPLLIHYVRFPQDFLQRALEVSALPEAGSAPGTSLVTKLWSSAQDVAGMFFLRGDQNPRYNLAGRPALTWWSLPLLLASLVALLQRQGRRQRLFLLLWLGVMLVPSWLSEYPPHFVRSIGALPPLCLLLADGGHALWQWIRKTSRTWARAWGRLAQISMAALLVLLVAAESVLSLSAFHHWVTSPEQFYAFDEGLLEIGRYAAQLPPDQLVYVSPTADHPTLTYSLTTEPDPPELTGFDGRHVFVSRPGEDAVYLVVAFEDYRFELMAPWYYPDEELQPELTISDHEGNVYAQVYAVPGTAQLRTPEYAAGIAWEDGVYLEGYEPVDCCSYEPGSTVYLELWWRTGTDSPQHAWTVFAHMVSPDGQLVAGDDSEPGRGSYPTTDWLPGDLIIDEYELQIPADGAPGEYDLEIGLYNWQTGQRLRLAGGSGDSVRLHPITIEPVSHDAGI